MSWLDNLNEEQLDQVIRAARANDWNRERMKDQTIIKKLLKEKGDPDRLSPISLLIGYFLCGWEIPEELCLAAIAENPDAIKNMEKQTHRVCLAAVTKDGHTLQYVKEQTEEICLAAVKQNGWAIKHVIKQTPEIFLEAIRQMGLEGVFLETVKSLQKGELK